MLLSTAIPIVIAAIVIVIISSGIPSKPSCFDENTLLTLNCGRQVKIKDIKIKTNIDVSTKEHHHKVQESLDGKKAVSNFKILKKFNSFISTFFKDLISFKAFFICSNFNNQR